MGKALRIFIAMVLLSSLTLLAKQQAARAANPAVQEKSSVLTRADSAVSQNGDDDCDDDRDQEKCKDKDKDKDKCKKKDDCGTVRPPDDDFDVCKLGGYSVGGVATLDVKKLQDRNRKDDCFQARTADSGNVSGLPKNAGKVLSELIVLTSVGQGTNGKICFAFPPGAKVKIYVSNQRGWKPVGTQSKNNIACAHIPGSGSYLLAGK